MFLHHWNEEWKMIFEKKKIRARVIKVYKKLTKLKGTK